MCLCVRESVKEINLIEAHIPASLHSDSLVLCLRYIEWIMSLEMENRWNSPVLLCELMEANIYVYNFQREKRNWSTLNFEPKENHPRTQNETTDMFKFVCFIRTILTFVQHVTSCSRYMYMHRSLCWEEEEMAALPFHRPPWAHRAVLRLNLTRPHAQQLSERKFKQHRKKSKVTPRSTSMWFRVAFNSAACCCKMCW